MAAASGLFDGLVDDAAMLPGDDADVDAALSAHVRFRSSWFGPVIGAIVVTDQRLAAVSRWMVGTRGPELAVSVVSTTGAGGLVSLARRDLPGLRVVAVESALRDLDDLAGNAARVVSAAAALDDEVSVYVEIPFAPGWERAVAEVEAAGLHGKLRTGGPDARDCPATDQLAKQLSVLVEADLPFKATAGPRHAWPTAGAEPAHPRQHTYLNLMVAVEALVDGASESEAADQLARTDRDALAAQVGSWSDGQASRVRRRVRRFESSGVLDFVGDLVALGLLGRPE